MLVPLYGNQTTDKKGRPELFTVEPANCLVKIGRAGAQSRYLVARSV